MTTSCLAGALTEVPGANDGQAPLPVYLARPTGAGPFPAVIVLHGCGGLNSVAVTWADRLASWGYVALAIDSLTPHHRTNVCGTGSQEQPFDAYQALKFLASQPFVRADRIAVLGISEGAGSVLTALERGLIEPMFPSKFRSGVAFYPRCAGKSGILTAPTLVLIGELDDWTPAAACRDMVAGETGAYGPPRQPGDRSMVELIVYPDTYHSFVASDLKSGARMYGHWLQYNDAATQDAAHRIRSFFERTLGD
jgi:dienelactone hydrolase